MLLLLQYDLLFWLGFGAALFRTRVTLLSRVPVPHVVPCLCQTRAISRSNRRHAQNLCVACGDLLLRVCVKQQLHCRGTGSVYSWLLVGVTSLPARGQAAERKNTQHTAASHLEPQANPCAPYRFRQALPNIQEFMFTSTLL
jgi:hypothetical protein